MSEIIYSPHRMWHQAFKTAYEQGARSGDLIQPFNEKVLDGSVCPTITTRIEGFKTAVLVVEEYE